MIQDSPGITAETVFKAALSLVNISRTGHSHALFISAEDGSTLPPFTHPTTGSGDTDKTDTLPNVHGPTMQGLCNLVNVTHTESAVSFLRRLQSEQHQLLQHGQAPIRRIITNLNATGDRAGDMLIDAHRAQFMVWVSDSPSEYERLRTTQMAIHCNVGLVIVASLDSSSIVNPVYHIRMRWDGANFSAQRTAKFASDLEVAVKWLVQKDNSNKPLVDLLASLA